VSRRYAPNQQAFNLEFFEKNEGKALARSGVIPQTIALRVFQQCCCRQLRRSSHARYRARDLKLNRDVAIKVAQG
jgi:hypothetical protein